MREDLEEEGTTKLEEDKGQKETLVLDNVVNGEVESTMIIFSETRTLSLSLSCCAALVQPHELDLSKRSELKFCYRYTKKLKIKSII